VVKRLQPVDARVASGAKSNEEAAVMNAGTAMVDGKFPIRPTALAAAAIPVQHTFALAGKAAAGMGVPPIASPAEAGTKELKAPARAEKPGLRAWPIHARGEGGGRPGKGRLSAESAMRAKGRIDGKMHSR